MASSFPVVVSGDNAEMTARLLEDFRKPDSVSMKVYTSARLLSDLIAGQLLRPAQERCETHELLLLPKQSGKPTRDSAVEVVSCLCAKCYHHFHIKVTAGSSTPFQKNHTMNMHVFVLSGRDSDKLLKATRVGEDHVLDRVHLVCIVDECHCRIELERLPPRISTREIDALGDKHRLARNLQEARSKEHDRVVSLGNEFNPNVFSLLRRYLSDGLDTDVTATPKRIKTHNKKFMIAFKDDFDDLLRTLGCTLHTLEDGDKAWIFPTLEAPSSPTFFGSRRAKWEDTEAECMLHDEPSGPRRIRPAWEMLQRVIACDNYENLLGSPPQDESDMVLLGCLANFKPKLFVEAAKLLSDKCPPRWEEFTTAAARSIGTRDSDSAEALAIYQSTVENSMMESSKASAISPEVIDAYQFFDTSLTERSPDHFISKYWVMLDANESDAFRSHVLAKLEVISGHLGIDLVGPFRTNGSDKLQISTNSKMSKSEAQTVLGADLDYSEEIIQDIVNHKAQDTTVDRAKVADALELFAEHHRSSNPDFAAKLDSWAGIFKSSNLVAQGGVTLESGQQLANVDPNAPPGLRNIGNTCYLNSLLQYLYSVVPLRNLVLQFPENHLDLSPESVQQRVLGYGNGITVNLEEAIIGRQFIEQLQLLFKDLLATTKVASEPSQKLANAALRSASELLDIWAKTADNKPADTAPPPLPARPSPAPPEGKPSEMHNVSVTVEPVNDTMETASAVSSQTLVNDDAAEPTGVSEKPTLSAEGPEGFKASAPETVATSTVEAQTPNALAHDLPLGERVKVISQRLEQSDRQGTDQQDVEEIIGFILEHLMRAISSNGPMPGIPNLQADAITNTFFPVVVNYTIRSNEGSGKPGVELNVDRWINAFPHEREGVSSTIYDALTRSFGLHYVDGNIGRYSALRSLSPVIHIRIQRANTTVNGATKNRNPVILTDELYFDRYMDAPDDSPLSAMRKTDWALQGHQMQLDELNIDRPNNVRNESAMAAMPKNELALQGHHVQPDNTNHEASMTSASVEKQTFNSEDAMNIDAPNSEIDDKFQQYLQLDSDEEAVEAILNSLPIRSGHVKKKRKFSRPVTNGTELPSIKQRSPSLVATDSFMTQFNKVLGGSSTDGTLKGEQTTIPKEQVERFYDSLTQQKYRLHAVICHSGGTRAGHYWVWIRDFSRNVWIKFNDSTVTVDQREPQAVIEELSKSGDPCYAAYVRDEDKDSIVGLPQRTPIAPQSTGGDVEMQTIEGVAPDDVEMSDLAPASVDTHAVTDQGIVEMDGARPLSQNYPIASADVKPLFGLPPILEETSDIPMAPAPPSSPSQVNPNNSRMEGLESLTEYVNEDDDAMN
ncbi:ubiquitin carboxyl-terminal hydrolase [Seiridium cupressi]